MTTILRLQGLDVKASTEDIRAFFKSCHIPNAGVYIVGGSLREAFIAFTSERDAQLALCRSGKPLKGSKVTLCKSSMEELEKRLMYLLKKNKQSSTKGSFSRPDLQPPKPADPKFSITPPKEMNIFKGPCSPDPIVSDLETSATIDSGTAFLLGVCTVLGLRSSHQEANKPLVPEVDKTCSTTISKEAKKPEEPLCLQPGYVRLFGLPQSATRELICHFFKGLEVEDVILNVKLGVCSGCLVKFANEEEACKALLFNYQLLDSNHIEVRRASEKMWASALQDCEDPLRESHESKKSPPQEPVTCEQTSESSLQKRRRVSQKQDSPTKQRADHKSTQLSSNREYMVMIKYLPKSITKTDIKELLGCPNIAHKNVLHLLDREGNRTDTAFVRFKGVDDYEYAINLTGCHVGDNVIEITSTTELVMKDMMVKARLGRAEHSLKKDRLNGEPPSAEGADGAPDPAALTCLFMRNMPAGVTETQVRTLLCQHGLSQGSVRLLTDNGGNGIGKAVVQFKSSKVAAVAQRLNGKDYLGSQLLLTRINVKQMQDILAKVKQH